ncbi:MAG: hypothetical protein F4040_05295 [Synechococcus sp. SB0670_bin_20]|nr:hypothetical protein [Synechococcus sp. SB0670_bin_20]
MAQLVLATALPMALPLLVMGWVVEHGRWDMAQLVLATALPMAFPPLAMAWGSDGRVVVGAAHKWIVSFRTTDSGCPC